ncbi:DNA methyltransferase [Streptomyces cyaneogriseus subsp. noncyanogenus]|uniref:DNA methyltransferase n=1 Tax=Streptomyces cyaneogriseus subsp. noncyanogenus TaxID=477245 RepID=A0A0C5G7M3_9ACTN|nr:DNA adenine methylase [Streptomyces cyaneogriseus]AJP04755.1 DNA methyltransferase [Streptomyces cyaneogriseus subsp. noncyanogenus]
MATAVRPPVPYFGSKQSIAPWIVSLLPDHEHYVEPYAGGLSVLLAKTPSKMETVNDLDGELVTFWRVLRDRPADLTRACALTPHSRAEQDAAYAAASGNELETARRVWVRLTQGRGGTLRRTGWRHYVDPAGAGTSLAGQLDGYVDRLAAAAERLHAVSLENLPALELIAKYGKQPRVLLYVDPPYLGSTRAFANYRHEMTGEAEHRELAAALADCRAAVVLSGYDSPLYDELYGGWHRYTTQTTADNANGDRGRTEVLWSNVRLGDQLDLFAEHLTP